MGLVSRSKIMTCVGHSQAFTGEMVKMREGGNFEVGKRGGNSEGWTEGSGRKGGRTYRGWI